MNSPQQTAEELEEKIASKITDYQKLCPHINLYSPHAQKFIAKRILIELNLAELLKDKEKISLRMSKQINKLLAHCGDTECSECAKIICPFKEELHFHHDGCPSCCNVPSGMICPDHETDKMIESAITAATNQPK